MNKAESVVSSNKKAKAILNFILNGKRHRRIVEQNLTLLEFLREDLKLTGTKLGCDNGTCGTCLVLVDGQLTKACVTSASLVAGKNLLTIEGVGTPKNLHPLQKAFINRHALQCGFCTPGMIIAAKSLLDKNSNPTEEEIKLYLRTNLCRCTGYQQIVEAVQEAAGILKPNQISNSWKTVGQEEKTNFHVIGKSVPMRDAVEKVTGKATYTSDIDSGQETLYLATVRSSYPHAKILKIDHSEALKYPGVIRIITAKDIPGENKYGKIIRDQPVLADEKVRFIGDAIALVVATSQDIANQAAKLAKVEYEVLPAIFSPREALQPEAPKLHPKGNILYHFKIRKGDTQAGFKNSDVVIERTYQTHHVDHAQLEPEAAIAYYDKKKTLTIIAPTQHVFFDRLNIIRALGIPKEDVRVIQPKVGGAFGKREDIYAQIHVALACFLTKKPIKTTYTRAETFLVTQKRHPMEIKLKSGVSKAGKLLALEAEIIGDTGAYASWGVNVLRKAGVHITGPYEIPNVKVDSYAVFTNNPFCGAMRGFGTAQAAFAYESQMDEMAKDLGMDPLEFRMKNGFKKKSLTATGQVLNSAIDVEKTIVEAAQEFGWANFAKKTSQNGKKYGKGMASIWYGIGFGSGIEDHGEAIVELHPNGKATLWVGTVDYGQGSSTIFCQMVAEQLGLRLEDVTIIHGDSANTPNCGSTVATKQTYVTGNAIKAATDKIRKDILEIVSSEWKVREADLQFGDGRVFLKNGNRSMSIKEVAKLFDKKGKPRRRQAIFKGEQFTSPLDPETGQGNAYFPYTLGTQVAEVEVDTQTGKIKVLRLVAAHHVGKALNPQLVRGQILGGISMGYGFALSEDAKVEKGVPQAQDFGKYKLMKSSDLPDTKVIIVESPEITGPFGAIGIGEPPTLATAPAIINAIQDACGARIYNLPATPDKILKALAAKNESR